MVSAIIVCMFCYVQSLILCIHLQIALQFYVSQNPYIFAREAADFAEVVTLLASESAGVDKVSAAVLGISTQENGLLSVIHIQEVQLVLLFNPYFLFLEV